MFVLADRALERVVHRIPDERWEMVMPADFQTTRETPPTLREVIGYHAYDDAWVPDMLAGRSMEEVGATAYDGDLLGDDPRAAFSQVVERACRAAEELDDLTRTVHCSFGDFTAQEYLWQVSSFRGLRAVDIARIVGVEADLPDDLVTGLWEEIAPHAEQWRAIGVFPAAVPVPEDAPLLERLLGLTGRQPRV